MPSVIKRICNLKKNNAAFMWLKKKFEDTKSVIRSRKDGEKIQWKNGKGKTIIYKTLHRKLSIEQQETH